MYKINTNREDFIIPQRLANWDKKEIVTSAFFGNEEGWILSELAAQTAGLHVRLCDEFQHQVFLLKMKSSPVVSVKVTGEVKAVAILNSSSSKAFDYTVKLTVNSNIFVYELIIALQEFTDETEKVKMTNHFEKVLACLTKK